jgi:O-antigen ligase
VSGALTRLMSARPSGRLSPSAPPFAFAAQTVLPFGLIAGAFLFGALLAVSVPLAAGAAGAVAYVGIVLVNLPVGVATWAGFSYFEALGPLELATKAAAVLVIVAAVLTVLSRRRSEGALPPGQRRLYALVVLFVVWITLSLAWAERPAFDLHVWKWWLAVAVFFMVVSIISSPRHVRLLCGGLVVGTLASVLPGMGSSETLLSGILPSLWGIEETGRLAGGLAGPNGLAAQILPALPLAAALAAGTSTRGMRIALLVGFVLLAIAVVATQSRGGLVAIAVASMVALVRFKGRRPAVLAFVACNLCLVGALVATTPEFVDRIVTDDNKGTGRGDAFRLAYEIGEDHPVTGVGLHNFPVYSQRYVDQLDFVENAHLVEGGLVVHNAYLELFAEQGLVGLTLFLLVAAGCCRALIVAARRFDELGERSLALLSDAVLVGIVATLTAAMFLSSGFDERLWILFGLGPAMLGIARRHAADHATRPSVNALPAWPGPRAAQAAVQPSSWRR